MGLEQPVQFHTPCRVPVHQTKEFGVWTPSPVCHKALNILLDCPLQGARRDSGLDEDHKSNGLLSTSSSGWCCNMASQRLCQIPIWRKQWTAYNNIFLLYLFILYHVYCIYVCAHVTTDTCQEHTRVKFNVMCVLYMLCLSECECDAMHML